MKLDDARLQILRMLDDPDGQRWDKEPAGSPFNPSNEVDIALQSAAIECVSSYVHGGGDFLDVVQEIVTDTDGTFSFQSLTGLPVLPIFIQSASYKSGDYYYSLHPIREQDVQVNVRQGIKIKVKLVYSPDFTNITNAVGDQELYYTRQVSYALPMTPVLWPMFDQWVCTVAAKQLTPKENEANAQLDDKVAMLRDACLKAPDMPKSVIFPQRNQYFSLGPALFRWSYASVDLEAGKNSCFRLHKVRVR